MKAKVTLIFFSISMLFITSFILNTEKDKTFYKSGKLKSEFYHDSTCKCDQYIEYYENGVVFKKLQYNNEFDKKDSIFFESGKISIASHWENENKDGSDVAFYENGSIAYLQNYKNGYNYGIWKYFNEDGSIWKTIEYDLNKTKSYSNLETNTTSYYKNKVLFLQETYKDNIKISEKISDESLNKEYQEIENNKSGAQIFRINCSMCHFKTDELFAPSLANLFHNQTDAWLIQKIKNDTQLLNDKQSIESKEKWNTTDNHTNFENLPDYEIEKIVTYIKSRAGNKNMKKKTK